MGLPVLRIAKFSDESDSDEEGKRDESDPDCDKKHSIGNEIRVDHQDKPAHHRHNSFLLLAIDEETEPDRAEDQTPEKPICTQCNLIL